MEFTEAGFRMGRWKVRRTLRKGYARDEHGFGIRMDR
jgi:hypothetical protein